MKITFLYNHWHENTANTQHRTFEVKNDKDILEIVLWLTSREDKVIAPLTDGILKRTVARVVKEVIVNGVHFETSKYSNPSDWVYEIKKAIGGK